MELYFVKTTVVRILVIMKMMFSGISNGVVSLTIQVVVVVLIKIMVLLQCEGPTHGCMLMVRL